VVPFSPALKYVLLLVFPPPPTDKQHAFLFTQFALMVSFDCWEDFLFDEDQLILVFFRASENRH